MRKLPEGRNTVKQVLALTILIALATTMMVGCSRSSKSAAGTYVNKANSSEYLELKANGEFYLRELGMGITGQYEIEGDTITLKFDMGLAARGRIRGKTIVDEDGKTWVKR